MCLDLGAVVPEQAHLKAEQFYSVIANMRGASPEEVSSSILSCHGLRGLQVLPLSCSPALLLSSLTDFAHCWPPHMLAVSE
jgi:hypothetical protein